MYGGTFDLQCQHIATVAGKSFNGNFTTKIDFPIEYFMLPLLTLTLEVLTLKEPGYFNPSHSRGGGGRIPPPLKISETDRWNIKCVVLVDSYDPPESIGTKKIQNIPCMTSQWRHKWRHVKNTKITKNRQNHGFSLFFSSKSCIF